MTEGLERLAVAVSSLSVVVGLLGATALFARQPDQTHSDQLVVELQAQLDQASDPATRASLEEKLKIAKASQEQELDARRTPIDKNQLREKDARLKADSAAAANKPTVTLPHMPAGDGFIVEGAVPQISSQVFLAENDWFIPTGDNALRVVWAGVQAQDRSQGEIVVIDERSGGFAVRGFYPTPTKHGSVRVTGGSGRLVTVVAEDGSTFKFAVDGLGYR